MIPLPKVSLVTACMGRLHHVRRTLPRNLVGNADYGKLEFVLLDYNSPDGLGDWVRDECGEHLASGRLRYFRTTQPTHWHMSHAKNVAHLCATGDLLVNVDGDNFTDEGFVSEVVSAMSRLPRAYARCGRWGDIGSMGRIAIPRDAFIALGGYDESMVGWGSEDGDLCRRAETMGYARVSVPDRCCSCIQHPDSEREARQTPPSAERKLGMAESMRRNRAIYQSNRRRRVTTVNTERPWGVATVVLNFSRVIEVGSDRLNVPAREADPVVAMVGPAVPAPPPRRMPLVPGAAALGATRGSPPPRRPGGQERRPSLL